MFETRMDIPTTAGEYLRVAAVAKDGTVFSTSKTVSRHEYTTVEPLYAPPPQHSTSVPFFLVMGICRSLTIVIFCLVEVL